MKVWERVVRVVAERLEILKQWRGVYALLTLTLTLSWDATHHKVRILSTGIRTAKGEVVPHQYARTQSALVVVRKTGCSMVYKAGSTYLSWLGSTRLLRARSNTPYPGPARRGSCAEIYHRRHTKGYGLDRMAPDGNAICVYACGDERMQACWDEGLG